MQKYALSLIHVKTCKIKIVGTIFITIIYIADIRYSLKFHLNVAKKKNMQLHTNPRPSY